MEFRDQKLEAHVQRVVSLMTDLEPDQRVVCGLVDAWYRFNLFEGENSPRATEAIEQLLSAELRPALRTWYSRWGPNMNDNALQFRERLSKLAGEVFG